MAKIKLDKEAYVPKAFSGGNQMMVDSITECAREVWDDDAIDVYEIEDGWIVLMVDHGDIIVENDRGLFNYLQGCFTYFKFQVEGSMIRLACLAPLRAKRSILEQLNHNMHPHIDTYRHRTGTTLFPQTYCLGETDFQGYMDDLQDLDKPDWDLIIKMMHFADEAIRTESLDGKPYAYSSKLYVALPNGKIEMHFSYKEINTLTDMVLSKLNWSDINHMTNMVKGPAVARVLQGINLPNIAYAVNGFNGTFLKSDIDAIAEGDFSKVKKGSYTMPNLDNVGDKNQWKDYFKSSNAIEILWKGEPFKMETVNQEYYIKKIQENWKPIGFTTDTALVIQDKINFRLNKGIKC